MLKKLKKLRIFAEEHHKVLIIKNKKRHLGIILTLVGWLFLSFYTVFFQQEATEFNRNFFLSSIFVEFSIFHFFMFLTFLIFCLSKGVKYLIPKEPKLIVWRSIFAIISFWFYSLSRIWTKTVDNSMLYSTDAFWIIFILCILGIKIKKLAFFGIITGFIGILFVYFFDISSIYDLIGGAFGIFSGITLGIIVIITSYMVKQDPPLRIGFYHSLLGLISSIFLAVIFSFRYGWFIPHINDIIIMMFSGFLFALTLFCLLEAFYYTETYIIGAISYFLPVFTEIINWIENKSLVKWTTIFGSSIITIGGLVVIISSYLKDKEHYSDSVIVKK